jgi:hypothetical protein
MILEMGKIPFKFHQGILFDAIDDLFDNPFLPARSEKLLLEKVIEKR